jgi:hypothetical protein
MRFDPSPNVLRTDFNSLSDSGLVHAARSLTRVTWGALDPGVLVDLLDGEGNTCQGVIVTTTPRAVGVKPIWATWRTSPMIRWSGLPAPTIEDRPGITMQSGLLPAR